MAADYRRSRSASAVFHVILYQPRDPAQHRQHHPAVRQHRLHAAPDRAAGLRARPRSVRRAGLDYAELAVRAHAPAASGSCLRAAGGARLFAVETGAHLPLQRGAVRARGRAAVRLRDTRVCRRRCCTACCPQSGASRSRCARATAASIWPMRSRWWCTRRGGRTASRCRRLATRAAATQSNSGLIGRIISPRTTCSAGSWSYSTP